MRIIFLLIKKVVIAICLLYSFNLIVSNFGFIIPINYISIIMVSILGFPSLIGLSLINKLL